MRKVQSRLFFIVHCHTMMCIVSTETFQNIFIDKHRIGASRAHLGEKHAFFAYLFLCSSSKWQIPHLIKVYISYIIVIYEHFYHNNPFLSVSYLHCFLFVCFYFRPLNKNSKVRCLKLFFILFFFHESKVVDMHFYSRLGWERGEMEGSEGGAGFLRGAAQGQPSGALPAMQVLRWDSCLRATAVLPALEHLCLPCPRVILGGCARAPPSWARSSFSVHCCPHSLLWADTELHSVLSLKVLDSPLRTGH